MELEELLYSLIPLVLIIVFSWLFSFLGSRARARMESEDGSRLGDRDDELMRIFRNEPDEERSAEADDEIVLDDEEGPGWDTVKPKDLWEEGAPLVTPDPIKPRWWGA